MPRAAVPSARDYAHLPTEQPNPKTRRLDRLSARSLVSVITAEDRRAATSVGRVGRPLARAVESVAEAFRRGGRLIYVGAGTSGRLGALDAAECPPTFGVAQELVLGIIAGGEAALRRSVEGAEDSPEDGARAVRDAGARDRDVVCGIATSGTTPFVIGALEEASRRDSTTAIFTCTSRPRESGLGSPADIIVELPVGPEVIAGSTRMKGG